MKTFTTMITPYQPDGKVDLSAVKRYTEWYLQKGLNGIFAVCQSSEIFYLSLEERAAINQKVYETVQQFIKQSGKEVTVVSSGHVSYAPEEQATELNRIYDSGTDALIWITNRLDPHNEGDDIWLKKN